MRVALVDIGQETNDFNPTPTRLADFAACGLYEGATVVEKLVGMGEVGGWIEAVRESGLAIETIPIIRAWSTPGGRLDSATFGYFQDKIRDGLRRAGKIDALMLQLHGACAADGIDDVEGEQIELCREILGPTVPIVLALDHHANVTRRIVANADAIVGHRTQPHDTFDTGKVAGELLIQIVTRRLKPVTVLRKLALITHQEQFLTAKPPMRTWFDRARAMEADPRVLQAAPFPMQPWLDVAEGGWAVTVTTDGDAALAGRLADELADLAWSMRETFLIREALPIDEALRRADAAPRGIVSLSDTGDTVFGGAAGDSTLILEAMLRLGLKNRALVPMIDPVAAVRLTEAGVGAEVTLPLGGCAATAFFRPVTVTGRVRALGSGLVKLQDGRSPDVDQGRAAILDVGNITILVTELRGVAGNMPEVYRALGVEPADYHMAVLKTASNFQYFAPLSSGVIRVDTTGPGQSDIMTLPWRRLPRPIFPLDTIASWRREPHG